MNCHKCDRGLTEEEVYLYAPLCESCAIEDDDSVLIFTTRKCGEQSSITDIDARANGGR